MPIRKYENGKQKKLNLKPKEKEDRVDSTKPKTKGLTKRTKQNKSNTDNKVKSKSIITKIKEFFGSIKKIFLIIPIILFLFFVIIFSIQRTPKPTYTNDIDRTQYHYIITELLIEKGYAVRIGDEVIYKYGSEKLMNNEELFTKFIDGLLFGSDIHDVDPLLELALIYSETRFVYDAYNTHDGIGLGQVVYKFWKNTKIKTNGVVIAILTNKNQLIDPYQNMLFSTYILSYYLKSNGGNTMKGIYSYNGGKYKHFNNKSSLYQYKKSKYIMEILENYNYLIDLKNNL